MKVVIQCAGRKDASGGTLRTGAGTPVFFVGQPDLAPRDDVHVFARPDDIAEDGRTWRAHLADYNSDPGENPLELLPAYRLYSHPAYRGLVRKFGIERVFILSAGWGLIPARFLTPKYDITFTAAGEPWSRRRKTEGYDDFRLIPDDEDEITFVGSRDYLPLFTSLTASLRATKIVWFASSRPPELPNGFRSIRFETRTRTNWHYECANALIAGGLEISRR
jgi:hypothetical protein